MSSSVSDPSPWAPWRRHCNAPPVSHLWVLCVRPSCLACPACSPLHHPDIVPVSRKMGANRCSLTQQLQIPVLPWCSGNLCSHVVSFGSALLIQSYICKGIWRQGNRLFCKDLLCFNTMPRRHMPLFVRFWKTLASHNRYIIHANTWMTYEMYSVYVCYI